MMRLWLDSYARRTFIASSTTLSVAAHAVIISAWVYATLPPPGMPIDGIANRTYPAYIAPPDRMPNPPGSREMVHYIEFPRDGQGMGDGPRTMGDERPTMTDPTVGHAPVDTVPAPPAVEAPGSQDSVFTVLSVDSAVSRSENSAAPAYPAALLAAHVMGFVSARYVVDTTGLADPSSFEIVQSTNPEFVNAVLEALPHMRFKPAKIGALRVRQLVEQTFSFRIDDSALAAPATSSVPRKSRPPD
jgi:hypothetical protein